jgi:hypothetical protein
MLIAALHSLASENSQLESQLESQLVAWTFGLSSNQYRPRVET